MNQPAGTGLPQIGRAGRTEPDASPDGELIAFSTGDGRIATSSLTDGSSPWVPLARGSSPDWESIPAGWTFGSTPGVGTGYRGTPTRIVVNVSNGNDFPVSGRASTGSRAVRPRRRGAGRAARRSGCRRTRAARCGCPCRARRASGCGAGAGRQCRSSCSCATRQGSSAPSKDGQVAGPSAGEDGAHAVRSRAVTVTARARGKARQLSTAATAATIAALGFAVGLAGDACHVASGTTVYEWDGVPTIWKSAIWFPFLVGGAVLGAAWAAERMTMPRVRTHDRPDAVLGAAAVLALYALTAALRHEPMTVSLVLTAAIALGVWAWWDPSPRALAVAAGRGGSRAARARS